MSDHVIGVDVSKYEVKIRDNSGTIESIIDYWNPDKSKFPINFVIQRTSYGGRKDEFVDFLYQQCLKIPIRGAYHYFSTGVTWQHQLETILKAIEGKEYYFFAIDYEKFYNNLNATSFAEMMELRKQLELVVKKQVMLYFNPDVYNTSMKPYNADAVINKFHLWIAQYPYKLFLNLDKGPSLPKGVNNYKIWQYGGADIPSAAGYLDGFDYGSYRKGIDLNIYNGTLEEMKQWLNISDDNTIPDDPTDPEIPEEPIVDNKVKYKGKVNSNVFLGLQVRESSVTGMKLGKLNANQEFEADIKVNINNEDWLHVINPIPQGWISGKYTKYEEISETPPIVENPELKPAIPEAFYLQSDLDLGISWDERFKTAKLEAYPATINLVGGKGQVQLSPQWLNQVKLINTPKQYARLWTDEHGWHNKPHGEIGRVQQVTFAHSSVWVTGEDENYYYVDIYYNDETPENLNTNYDKYRINIFSIMSKNDAKENGGIFYDDTGFIKTLMIANNKTEKLKIEKKYCKPLMFLPINCKIKTDGSNLNVREFPVNGKIITSIKNNSEIKIIKLEKINNKIWGKINDGWIATWLTDLNI